MDRYGGHRSRRPDLDGDTTRWGTGVLVTAQICGDVPGGRGRDSRDVAAMS